MPNERTLSIVKPDGVRKKLIGEVIKRFESNGIKVVAMKMLHMDKAQAEGFYAVHKDKPFFNSVVEFMTSGPSVVMVLEGEDVIQRNRALMGATNPADAEPGTIRDEFGSDIQCNIVHGSDGTETAAFEIGHFFGEDEIQNIVWGS
jgi:nucleoside-diphosphate kinase